MTIPAAPTPVPAPTTVQPVNDTAPATSAAQGQGGVPASSWGFQEDGGFAAKLGAGLRLSAEHLANGEIDLTGLPQPIPGLRLQTAQFNTGAKRLDITSAISIPHFAEGDFRVRITRSGNISIRGGAKRELALPGLGNPEFRLSITDEGQLAGQVTVKGANLVQGQIRGLEATGSGSLSINAGKVSGNGSATLTYRDLGTGTINFNFTEAGAFSADGTFVVTPPFMNEVSGDISVDAENNIAATANLGISEIGTRVPGLTLDAGTLTVTYENGIPDATLTNFSANYAGFGQITIATATLDRSKRFSGSGSFGLNLEGVADVTGNVRLANGNVTGSVRLQARDLPTGLPVSSGFITATLGENNALGFAGRLAVDLGPAGSGDVTASYNDAGDFSIGADFDLAIAGLTSAAVRVDYTNGDLSGEAQVPIDTAILPGLDGSVTVRYDQGLWSGETELNYTADNGKLSGVLRITVAQSEEGALQIGGGGSVTAQLMPRLEGTLTAEILPEGGVDISGAIEVTEPLELFPEKRMDKELFKYSQNIPLWAILVAVIRVRAGVRAGVGPGEFHNIRVEGSYTVGQDDADPSFSISGEMFIPAFVEGYVSFGAGLGLDVVLGSLTGGIEGVATAGIYGAISVVPELSYQDGDWAIEGTATMAAGARLKLGLNAWAEVEALWATVWEREWELASHTMSIGPDLALQAKMSYKFGQPQPPEIEMNSSEIDTESMIQDAMPKDGPAASGARDALDNKAQWQGALREQREAQLPPELVSMAQEGETAPQPAQSRSSGGSGGNPPAAGGQTPAQNGASQNPNTQNQASTDAARNDNSAQGAVPADQVPNAADVRYPRPLTLASLDEAPATVPRAKEQEQQDVNAALRVLELASSQASDSDTLDELFPAIKRRFRLATLGYVGDFQRGFKIRGGVNPSFDFEPNEPLRGTGLPADLSGDHLSLITWETSTIGGSQVGVKMEANPLGPDHPAGSEPARNAQRSLMDKLPTDPGQHSGNANRFIRGHLLNHWIGGPGTPRNMFPITSEANAQHSRTIEQAVKNWVNERRFWVKYTVDVVSDETLVKSGTQTLYGNTVDMYSINSRLVAQASVLDTELQSVPNLTRRVTINSTFKQSVDPSGQQSVDQATLDSHQARQVDQDATIRLPENSAGPPTFPANIEAALTSAFITYGRDGTLERLKGFRGFAAGSQAVLLLAYDQIHGRRNKAITGLNPSQKGTFTRINNAWDHGLGATLI